MEEVSNLDLDTILRESRSSEDFEAHRQRLLMFLREQCYGAAIEDGYQEVLPEAVLNMTFWHLARCIWLVLGKADKASKWLRKPGSMYAEEFKMISFVLCAVGDLEVSSMEERIRRAAGGHLSGNVITAIMDIFNSRGSKSKYVDLDDLNRFPRVLDSNIFVYTPEDSECEEQIAELFNGHSEMARHPFHRLLRLNESREVVCSSFIQSGAVICGHFGIVADREIEGEDEEVSLVYLGKKWYFYNQHVFSLSRWMTAVDTNPNCELRLRLNHLNFPEVGVVALKDIEPGIMLTYIYASAIVSNEDEEVVDLDACFAIRMEGDVDGALTEPQSVSSSSSPPQSVGVPFKAGESQLSDLPTLTGLHLSPAPPPPLQGPLPVLPPSEFVVGASSHVELGRDDVKSDFGSGGASDADNLDFSQLPVVMGGDVDGAVTQPQSVSSPSSSPHSESAGVPSESVVVPLKAGAPQLSGLPTPTRLDLSPAGSLELSRLPVGMGRDGDDASTEHQVDDICIRDALRGSCGKDNGILISDEIGSKYKLSTCCEVPLDHDLWVKIMKQVLLSSRQDKLQLLIELVAESSDPLLNLWVKKNTLIEKRIRADGGCGHRVRYVVWVKNHENGAWEEIETIDPDLNNPDHRSQFIQYLESEVPKVTNPEECRKLKLLVNNKSVNSRTQYLCLKRHDHRQDSKLLL